MQVSVENTGNLGRRMTVSIPAEKVEQQVKQKLTNMAKNIRMPGFRPGKAPVKIVEGQYGEQVLHEVAGSLIESSLGEAFQQEELMPAGTPDIESTTIERGKDLEYVASFDVFPSVERTDLSGVRIERPVCEVEDGDVERTLESMRKQKTTYSAVDRAAADQDQLTLDFEGSIDGEPFAGGQAEDYSLVLGAGQFLPDFEKALLGAKAGEQKTAEVRFPEDYPNPELADKEAVFSIDVKAVAEPKLPEIDEDFIREFGIEDGDLEKLKQEIRENLGRERDERVSRLCRQRVMDALIGANQLEIPTKLVEREIDSLIETNKSLMEQQGIPTDRMVPDRQNFRGDAERRVALGLILSEVVQTNDLKPEESRVRERVEKMAASYQDPEAFVRWYYSSEDRIRQIESLVLEEQVVEHLLKGADTEDVDISLEDLIATPTR